MVITQKMYDAYESVRESGETNMFDVRVVSELSGLEKDEIMEIMTRYGELVKKFDPDR